MNNHNDLLRPSLSGIPGSRQSIYSPMVGYLSGFFGGPLSAAVVAMANSRRLGRMKTDLPLALLAIALVPLLLLPSPWGISNQLRDWIGEPGQRIALRVAGLLVFGAFYRLHARYHRGMDVMGINAPSGWMLGIGATVTGFLVSAVIMATGRS